jgi:LacI family transcriptional regulator
MDKLKRWLSRLPKPIGVLASSDDIGRFVLEAAKYINVNIPASLAVMGIDNDELICELCDPPLSSITRNVEKAGFQAAEVLDQMVSGRQKNPDNIYIEPVSVVSRESTSFFAVEDPVVLKAIKFIQNNYRREMYVEDVAGYVMVSPKTLHRKFKKTFGISVFDKINELRIESISQLLSETTLPISEIARQVGDLDYKHLSRLFKKYKNMTPSEFREKYQII